MEHVDDFGIRYTIEPSGTVHATQVYRLRYDIVGALNRAMQHDGMPLDEFYWNATGTY